MTAQDNAVMTSEFIGMPDGILHNGKQIRDFRKRRHIRYRTTAASVSAKIQPQGIISTLIQTFRHVTYRIQASAHHHAVTHDDERLYRIGSFRRCVNHENITHSSRNKYFPSDHNYRPTLTMTPALAIIPGCGMLP